MWLSELSWGTPDSRLNSAGISFTSDNFYRIAYNGLTDGWMDLIYEMLSIASFKSHGPSSYLLHHQCYFYKEEVLMEMENESLVVSALF